MGRGRVGLFGLGLSCFGVGFNGVGSETEQRRRWEGLDNGRHARTARATNRIGSTDRPSQLQVPPWERATQTQRVVAMLLGGGFAGAFSWIFTLPIDQIKTVVQSQRMPSGGSGGASVRGGSSSSSSGVPGDGRAMKSIRQLVRQQTAEEGYGAFFRGMGPTLSRAFVVNAVTFCVFETVLGEIGGEMSVGGGFVDVEEAESV